eukprot:scaffold65387_cov61-Phaeocystis_antarctica.AAC.7
MDSSRGATSRAATSALRWGQGVGAVESVADAIEYMLSGARRTVMAMLVLAYETRWVEAHFSQLVILSGIVHPWVGQNLLKSNDIKSLIRPSR